MKQHVTLRQQNDNSTAGLWWKPLFSLQRELSQSYKKMVENSVQVFFAQPTVWDMQAEMLDTMHRNTHRVFGEMYNNRQLATGWFTGNNIEPFVDIVENCDNYKVIAEVPGGVDESINVSVMENALCLEGEKALPSLGPDDVYIRKECHHDAFRRTIALPDEADGSKAVARIEGSVLVVDIPKRSQERGTALSDVSINQLQESSVSGKRSQTKSKRN